MSNLSVIEKLLDGATVEWKALGDVAKIQRGRVMSKEYLIENAGNYPVYSSQTTNNGEIGKINISEATHAIVKEKYQCTHRGKICAKNKGEVDMYFVERK